MAHKIGITEIQGGTDETPGASQWRTVMKIYPKADIQGDKIENFVAGYGGCGAVYQQSGTVNCLEVEQRRNQQCAGISGRIKSLVKDMQQRRKFGYKAFWKGFF